MRPRFLSFEMRELVPGGRSSQVGAEQGANRSRSVRYWRLRASVVQARQSVKLIGVIILIEYDYQVVSNRGTTLHGTGSQMALPCGCAS
jgi:hypothetical protein